MASTSTAPTTPAAAALLTSLASPLDLDLPLTNTTATSDDDDDPLSSGSYAKHDSTRLRAENDAMRTEMLRYRDSVHAAQLTTRHEMEGLKAALAAVHAQLPALRDKLAATKADFSRNLLVSAERYAELSRLPAEELSLLEHVQARVHELVQKASSGGPPAAGAAAAMPSRADVAAAGLDAAADRERIAFLERRLETATAQLADAEVSASKREAVVAGLQAEAANLKSRLLEAAGGGGAAAAGAARFEEQSGRLEEQAALSRRALEELHARQLEQMREARDLARADADKWQTRHAEVRRQHEQLLAGVARERGEVEAALANARADVRLKTFEAERLGMQCEQALGDARRDALQADAAREKLELLKGEYYELQAREVARSSEAESRLRQCEEKLAAYEALEAELDRAVLASGGAPPAGVSVPTSAKRRLAQSLSLSRDLLAARRDADAKGAEVRAAQDELERLREQVTLAQRRARLAHSPQQHLIDQLEGAEARAKQCEADAKGARAEAEVARAALGTARQQHKLLKSDLERLLQQRGSLDALRTTLSRLL